MYAGIDPIKFLATTDETERSVMQAIAREAREMIYEDDHNRAQHQANLIAKMFS